MFYYQACVTLTVEMLFGLQTGVTHQLFVTCAIFEGPHLQAASKSKHERLVINLNIGNIMRMDQGLPNHRRMAFWQGMPTYWNADRENYKPAPPVVRRVEL